MRKTNPALLDALADCLAAGDPLGTALGKVAVAGTPAGIWAAHVGRSLPPDHPIGAALDSANAIDADEQALLSAEGARDRAAAVLRAVALRRRRHGERRREVLQGLLGPILIGVLTVFLDPLPDMIGGGSYFWPLVRGLLALALLVGIVVGVLPALLRDPRIGPTVLRVSAALPGLGWLAARYAEEELTVALAPFVEGSAVSGAGLGAAASFVAWSPFAETLRTSRRALDPASGLPSTLAMGGLEPLARQLSVDTNLAIIGGVACGQLAERLTARGDALSTLLTARLRFLVRLGAYALVLVFSLVSLAGLLARGIPGMPTLPGGSESAEQKQLDELMKQLEAQ